MINAILKDSAERPELFRWFGELPIAEVELWEHEQSLSLPQDLKSLWITTGGGDLFESETILQPFGSTDDNLVLPVSQISWENGLEKDHYLFHVGCCVSAFRKSDAMLVTMALGNMAPIAVFRDLDDWYRGTLIAEYGYRYRLSVRGSHLA